MDAFCPSFSSLRYFFSFLLHWPSPTPFQPVSLTYMLAEPIREHLGRHSHPAALGIPDPRCHSCALYRIHHLPRYRLQYDVDHPSCDSSVANFRCPKCFQVCYPRQFRLDHRKFSGFGAHSRFEFVFQGGPLQTKLVEKVIFLTISMQPLHHVQRVTRRLCRSLQCPKCIQRLSSACFVHEIPSVSHIGFGCPATSPFNDEPWPFGAISIPPPLSSIASRFLCLLYPIPGHCPPKSRYWLEQSAWQQHFRKGPRLWFSTASSQ